MGKEWEDRQMDRLKAKQQAKIDQMALQVEKEITTSQVKKTTAQETQIHDYPDCRCGRT